MGQKVHPTGIRLGIVKDHNSVWYANKRKYADNLLNDLKVRAYIQDKLKQAAVSRVVIERPAQNARVTIFTARPGIVIGKRGSGVEQLKAEVSSLSKAEVFLNIIEVKNPEANAKLIQLRALQTRR